LLKHTNVALEGGRHCAAAWGASRAAGRRGRRGCQIRARACACRLVLQAGALDSARGAPRRRCCRPGAAALAEGSACGAAADLRALSGCWEQRQPRPAGEAGCWAAPSGPRLPALHSRPRRSAQWRQIRRNAAVWACAAAMCQAGAAGSPGGPLRCVAHLLPRAAPTPGGAPSWKAPVASCPLASDHGAVRSWPRPARCSSLLRPPRCGVDAAAVRDGARRGCWTRRPAGTLNQRRRAGDPADAAARAGGVSAPRLHALRSRDRAADGGEAPARDWEHRIWPSAGRSGRWGRARCSAPGEGEAADVAGLGAPQYRRSRAAGGPRRLQTRCICSDPAPAPCGGARTQRAWALRASARSACRGPAGLGGSLPRPSGLISRHLFSAQPFRPSPRGPGRPRCGGALRHGSMSGCRAAHQTRGSWSCPRHL
jgi:hypothetical protein